MEEEDYIFEQKKKEIMDAISAKDYEISIEEPNNVSVYEHEDGTEYIVVYDMDDCRSSTDFGECTLDIAGHWFTCNLGTGEWECDDDELLDDEEIMDAIMDIDGMLYGEMTDVDSEVRVYNAAYGTDISEYYWYEDDDCPLNSDEDEDEEEDE